MELFMAEMQRENPCLDHAMEAIEDDIRHTTLYPLFCKQLKDDLLKESWKCELRHMDAKDCPDIEMLNPDALDHDIPELIEKLVEMKNRFMIYGEL